MSADPRTDPPTPDPLTSDAGFGATMDGPNTHKMAAPSNVTNWTVVRTTREVASDDGRRMESRDEWWHVPTFVVEEIERSAAPPSAPDQRLRDAAYETVAWSVVEVGPGSYQCRECHADVTDVNAPHDPDCVHDALRAALSEATTSPEATLDVWDRDLTVPEKERLAHALAVSDYRNWQPYEVADKIAGTVRTIAAARLRGPA